MTPWPPDVSSRWEAREEFWEVRTPGQLLCHKTRHRHRQQSLLVSTWFGTENLERHTLQEFINCRKIHPFLWKASATSPPPAIENNRRSLKFRDVCPASPRPKTSLFNCWSISIERLDFDLICKWCTLSTRLSWLSDPGWKLLKNVFWHIPNSGGAHVSGGPTSKRTGGGSRWRQPKPHPPVKPGRKKKLPTPRQKHNWLSQRSR